MVYRDEDAKVTGEKKTWPTGRQHVLRIFGTDEQVTMAHATNGGGR